LADAKASAARAVGSHFDFRGSDSIGADDRRPLPGLEGTDGRRLPVECHGDTGGNGECFGATDARLNCDGIAADCRDSPTRSPTWGRQGRSAVICQCLSMAMHEKSNHCQQNQQNDSDGDCCLFLLCI
jgi:hypothetical protein